MSADQAQVFFEAVQSGDAKSVGLMLYTSNMPVDAKNSVGVTALCAACSSGKSDVIQLLLEHGANPNTVDSHGASPLHITAFSGDLDAIRLLIGFGADVNAQDKDGLTPVESAKKREKGGAPIIKELSKAAKGDAARIEDAARFKAHGNKVFAEGENVKAAKFYGQAILNDQSNHVYFSNRAACFFNLGDYDRAYVDACRCVALNPKFARGYFRKAAAQLAQKDFSGAKKTATDGLACEPQNKDLLSILSQVKSH